MSDPSITRLAELTTEQLATIQATHEDLVVLLPVGSVEPHGPHLPLATDTIISQAVAEQAALRLDSATRRAFLAPALPYGVTDYAAGFAGAISLPADVLSSFLRALIDAYLAAGFTHVCLINNHLEPEQDRAVRAALDGLDARQASVACPLTRRWGRTLSAEFKSGACHAGRYETSLVMVAAPEQVKSKRAAQLPSLDISLSRGIRDGLTTFAAMGIEQAYTGAPAEATPAEGSDLLELLATMVVTEVEEALS